MSIKRTLARVDRPASSPGFLGPGHMARPLISGPFTQSDPFILLMDDILDKTDTTPVGGPHPHAGFETVSFLLEGEIGDENHKMKAGDFQVMTAGSGIIHTETIDKIAKMRLLQLWITLPKKDRWATPRVQDLPVEHVPSLTKDGVHIKLYSGRLAGLTSPLRNYVPMIVADISLEAGTATLQQIPADYNTFLYVISGSVYIAEAGAPLNENEVGWLNLPGEGIESDVALKSGDEGVRLVLYAAKPTGESIVSYGPFIADSAEDIQRLFKEYRGGDMKHISTVPAGQRIVL